MRGWCLRLLCRGSKHNFFVYHLRNCIIPCIYRRPLHSLTNRTCMDPPNLYVWGEVLFTPYKDSATVQISSIHTCYLVQHELLCCVLICYTGTSTLLTGHEVYSFFNLGARWGLVVNATPPAALLPGKRHGTHYRGSWVGPQGRSVQVRKISPLSGIRYPDRPARSESLHRPSYPGSLHSILSLECSI
jgi:hypothetical protein